MYKGNDQNDMKRLIISTDQFPERDRFEIWREEIIRNFSNMRIERRKNKPFFARADIYEFDNLQFGMVHAAEQRAFLDHPEKELYMVNLQLTGTSLGVQGKRRWITTPGDIDILDSSKPAELGMDEECSSFVLIIPHPMLNLPNRDQVSGMCLQGRTPFERIAASYLQELARLREFGTDARTLIKHFLPVLAHTLNPTDEAAHQARPSVREMSRLKVLGFIERHIANPNLDPETIATGCRMSKRSLHLLFEDSGKTCMQTVQSIRLKSCRKALADPAMSDRTILQIVEEKGFNNLSHFNRVFKQAYEMTPSEWREKSSQPT